MMACSDGRYWDEPAQTMPRPELRAVQEERLRAALARVWEAAPLYRRMYEAAGIGPDDVKGLDDLAQLPRCTKADLRASEAAAPPVGDYRCLGLRGAVRLATSTGTTGRPTFSL